MTVKLPARVQRDVIAYAESLARESAQPVDPASLIAPMLIRIMAADRVLLRAAAEIHRTAEAEETADYRRSPSPTSPLEGAPSVFMFAGGGS